MDKSLKDKISDFLSKIDGKYNIDFAYLFGSIARGTERVDSDIDIAIKFVNDYSDVQDAFIRGEIIENGKLFFDRDIDVISLNKASINLMYEVVKDGVVIRNSINRSTFESLVLREYFDFKYYSDIYNEKIINNIKNERNSKEYSYGE